MRSSNLSCSLCDSKRVYGPSGSGKTEILYTFRFIFGSIFVGSKVHHVVASCTLPGELTFGGTTAKIECCDEKVWVWNEVHSDLLKTVFSEALVVDISPRPGHEGPALARAMQARYLALPRADAKALHRAIAHTAPEPV